MAKHDTDGARFDAYVERLAHVVGHADRRWPLRAYLTGLLLPGERKSVEPLAARIDPRHVSRAHQSMHHFVASAPWDDQGLLAIARDYALEQLERNGPVGAWVVDDTGIPKKGKHSVGVARQYCGRLGKQENCQVAVSISFANETMSVPAAWRLYLPKVWADDSVRRDEVGIPRDVVFLEKWRIALHQIDSLLADDIPMAPVVADAGYGDITEFRDELTDRGFSYVVGIKPDTTVWPAGETPLRPKYPICIKGCPAKAPGRDGPQQRPISVCNLAKMLPRNAWKDVRWREGTKGAMTSRFAMVRVRPAHGNPHRESRPEEWLLMEWPKNEPAPTKYCLSTVPEDVGLPDLVSLGKIRWRIERDYQELKSELGLEHYEGRGWRGFHHHGTLCIAAYCFLAAERGRLSPPQPVAFLKAAALPKGFIPRGSPRKAREA